MATAGSSVTPQLHPLLRWPAAACGDLGKCEQNLWRAALLVAALILGFELIGWSERQLGRNEAMDRVVGNAAEAATRYFTIPHVIVGFLFMVTSTRNRTPRKRTWIAGLLAVGTGLCFAYGELLSTGGRLLGAAFLYTYFLVHELRDEMNFYRLLDGSKQLQEDRHFRRFSREQIGLLLVGVVFVLWIAGTMRTPAVLAPPGVSVAEKIGIMMLFAITLLAAMAASYAAYAARRQTTIARVVTEHRQMIRLVTAVFVLTIVGALATNRLYPIILLHVLVWYVVTCRMLKQRPPTEARFGTLAWMKGSLSGFRTLHIGLAAVCFLFGAVVVYTNTPLDHLHWMISSQAFPYWTIMHISVSFVPR